MARVYVGNVPYRSTEDEIRAVFEQAGCAVSEVVIPKLPDGRSKGFAFVEVDNLESALKVDGHELDSRPLRVSEARPMQDRGNRGEGAAAPAPKEETVDMSDDAAESADEEKADESEEDAADDDSEEDDDSDDEDDK